MKELKKGKFRNIDEQFLIEVSPSIIKWYHNWFEQIEMTASYLDLVEIIEKLSLEWDRKGLCKAGMK